MSAPFFSSTVRAALLALLLVTADAATAQSLGCSAPFQIVQEFANGAKWEMCWERRDREGIVLQDINYTSIEGDRRKVLYQASVAQIHVPYDDDGARYHDVSDFGLGFPRYLNDLTPADCPLGTLLRENGKDVICQSLIERGAATATAAQIDQGDALVVFSVSHVGAYNYIPEWRFFDDGTIEIAMGATGRLQRYTDLDEYGWPVRGELLPIGVSHLHNYYWRLDFDLNTDSGADSNDVFEEIEFLRDPSDLTKRQLNVTRFETEAARSMNPQTSRFWRVRDGAALNADNRPISYDILALDTGHRDVGPDFEPFTFNDVYVTAYRGCERFASHNPADASGGCAANEDLSDFVDGQNLVGGDLVVWFGLTFHHIPRDEDENYMHSHWNHFRLSPRDWTAGTLASEVNGAPSIDAVPTQENAVGDAVGLTLAASDPDGDAVTFTAAGLPTGLSIATATGHISGTASTAGNYFPTVTATDTYAAADSVSFLWHVQSASNSNPVVVNPGPQLSQLGEAAALTIGATDADGDALDFLSAGLPPGLAIDVGGTIAGQPTAVGSFQATVTVIDNKGGHDDAVFNWEVNGPPSIAGTADQRTAVDEAVTLPISATDPDGDALSFTASGLPNGLSISPGGVISGVADTLGAFEVLVTATDGRGGSSSDSFTWDVIAGCADCVDLNQLVLGSYSNQDLSGSASVQDGGASLYLEGNTWKIGLGQTYTITPNTMLSFTFESSSEGEIHGIGFDESGVPHDENRVFRLYGRQDGVRQGAWGIADFATYTGPGPESFVIPVGQYYTGTGLHLVFVNDDDTNSGTNTSKFTDIRVYEFTPEPSPPVLDDPGAQTSSLNTAVSLQVTASDVNGDALTFLAVGLPPGLTMSSGGLVTGIPTVLGTTTVTVTVDDGVSGTDTATFDWTVVESAVCAGCVDLSLQGLGSYSNQDLSGGASVQDGGASLYLEGNTWKIGLGQTYTITPNTMLAFTFESSSEGEIHGIGFDESGVPHDENRVFRLYGRQDGVRQGAWGIADFATYTGPGPEPFVIPVGQYYTGAGLHLVFVNDDDTNSGTNTSKFTDIRVYEFMPDPAPPVLDDPGAQTSGLNTAVSLQVTASDVNGDALTFLATGLPPGLTMSSGGLVTGIPTVLGTTTVTVTVDDGVSGTDTATFDWTVVESTVCAGCVDLSLQGLGSYSNQDLSGGASVQDGGASLYLEGNTWKIGLGQTYTITPNTMLAFTFESSSEGEIHGIGFDESGVPHDENRVFRLYGRQDGVRQGAWGIADFATYTGPGPEPFVIPVGQYYTGTGLHLVFVNDDDTGPGTNNSRFTDVKIYEAP